MHGSERLQFVTYALRGTVHMHADAECWPSRTRSRAIAWHVVDTMMCGMRTPRMQGMTHQSLLKSRLQRGEKALVMAIEHSAER